MTDLAKRVLFAVPAAVFFLWITWLGSWYFNVLIIIIGLLIQHEIIDLGAKSGHPPNVVFSYLLALWVMLYPWLPHFGYWGVTLFLLFVVVEVFNHSEKRIARLTGTLYFGIYAPLGMLSIMMIRGLGYNETGFALTLMLLLMVWGNDIFAYFGGKYLGKHAFAPKISPKKTWEGFGFGFLGALVGLLIAIYALPYHFPLTLGWALPLFVISSIFGPMGDLTESKIKRAAGVKDSASILPGHGGFFDRFDAMILCAPALLIYLKIIELLGYAQF